VKLRRPTHPVVCLGVGYWLRRGSTKTACAPDEICARALPSKIVTTGFVVASLLIVAVLALDLLVHSSFSLGYMF
jgi:mercuric ion transport protein